MLQQFLIGGQLAHLDGERFLCAPLHFSFPLLKKLPSLPPQSIKYTGWRKRNAPLLRAWFSHVSRLLVIHKSIQAIGEPANSKGPEICLNHGGGVAFFFVPTLCTTCQSIVAGETERRHPANLPAKYRRDLQGQVAVDPPADGLDPEALDGVNCGWRWEHVMHRVGQKSLHI